MLFEAKNYRVIFVQIVPLMFLIVKKLFIERSIFVQTVISKHNTRPKRESATPWKSDKNTMKFRIQINNVIINYKLVFYLQEDNAI